MGMCGFAGQGALQMWVYAASTAMLVVCAAAGACGSWELLCACAVVGRLGSQSGGWKELFGEAARSTFPRGWGAFVGIFETLAACLCKLYSRAKGVSLEEEGSRLDCLA